MIRYDAIKEIMEHITDELVIGNIGFPSKELYKIKDRNKNFYMLGSMGLASSIGLGISLSQNNQKVISLDGDGSILMNLGTLVTIKNQNPHNYILIILDNGAYGSTGNQETYAKNTDILKIVKSMGYNHAYEYEEIDFNKILKKDLKEPVIIRFKIEPGNSKSPVIPISPENIKNRFMEKIN
ncbi:MAG: sulfopyruvate decarboxylase subunit beta [Methanobacteriaceae archaeon]|nr:sulfopyruvate decarboxylase subunit beta [Methanobacteriaceae archaeon]